MKYSRGGHELFALLVFPAVFCFEGFCHFVLIFWLHDAVICTLLFKADVLYCMYMKQRKKKIFFRQEQAYLGQEQAYFPELNFIKFYGRVGARVRILYCENTAASFSQMGEEKITDNARKTKNEERAVCTHTLSVYVHQFYTSAKHHKKSIY